MTTRTPLEELPAPPADDRDGDLSDRIHRLEGEMAEVRHTLTELAEIVVGDIKERREGALVVAAPVPDTPAPTAGNHPIVSAVNAARRPWLLIDLFREIGATVRMYMDARYRVRRGTQLMVPLIFGLFVANYFFFAFLFPIPVAAEILERVVAVVLAVLLYKVLSREVARYRQMVAQIAALPRAWSAVPVSLLTTDADTAPVTRQESP